MKIRSYLFVGMLSIMLGMMSISPASAQFSITTGVRFNAVQDDFEERTSGTEVTIPFGLAYTRDAFSLGLHSGYADAQAEYPDGEKAELANLTDTLLTVNYIKTGWPLIVSLGMNANLPTGKARITMQEGTATLGEANDLFEVEKFGEGLNVGGSLGLMKQFETAMIGINGLYVYKGPYDPTADFEDDDVDPGDQTLVAGIASWTPSEAWAVVSVITHSSFGEDETNGEKKFQEGSTLTLSGAVNYRREPLAVALSVQGILPNKDRAVVDGEWETEPDNSGSKTLIPTLGLSYTASPSVVLELMADMRYYAESERIDPENGLPYAGKRIRYSVGPGLLVTFKKLTGSIRAKYVFVDEKADIYLTDNRTFAGIDLKSEIALTF